VSFGLHDRPNSTRAPGPPTQTPPVAAHLGPSALGAPFRPRRAPRHTSRAARCSGPRGPARDRDAGLL